MSIYVALLFIICLAVSMPIAHGLFVAGVGAMALAGKNYLFGQTIISLYDPTQKFPMIAIPLFILAGDLMMSGRFGSYLISFAQFLVGRLRGGLAQVSVLGSLFFGGVSGSAVADASAIGNALIPVQKKQNYPAGYPAAVNAASSTISVLIPPSIPLILYGLVTETSIVRLFVAGIIPGLLLAIGLSVLCHVIAVHRGLPPSPLQGGRSYIGQHFLKSLPALCMPVFVVICARGGVLTPTEISVFAVAYALVIGMLIYRDLSWSVFLRCILTSGIMTGVIMLVVMGSSVVQWILSVEQVPQMLASWLVATVSSEIMVILMINLLMIAVGTFLDLPAAILLLAPILITVARAIGLDSIQLGLMMVMNLAIGLYTPPVGTTLFVSVAIERVPMGRVIRELLPFYLWALTVLALVSFVPILTSLL
ncbi:MAG: TRAP transporter large permease [Pseudomonadota bacterium]